MIYSLTVLARITDNCKYIKIANNFYNKNVKNFIPIINSNFDLSSGVSGLASAVFSLFQLTNSIDQLNHSKYLVEFSYEKFLRQISSDYSTLIGMSHGTSGLINVLSKIEPYYCNGEINNMIQSVLNYENRHFVKSLNIWPDLRYKNENSFKCINQWCHGALGVFYSREHLKNSDQFMKYYNQAVKTSLNLKLPDTHSVCCGIASHFDFINNTNIIHNEKKLIKDKQDLINFRLVDQFNKNKSFKWSSGIDDCYNLGFFNGLSGIGYVLLRNEIQLPNVLTFE